MIGQAIIQQTTIYLKIRDRAKTEHSIQNGLNHRRWCGKLNKTKMNEIEQQKINPYKLKRHKLTSSLS